MKNTEQIVRKQADHLWSLAGLPKEIREQFWLGSKSEFTRVEDPLWVTEEAATARRSRSLLEDNPASG
jgi:hypothetical protein